MMPSDPRGAVLSSLTLFSLAANTLVAQAAIVNRPTPPIAGGCRFIPGDVGWPSQGAWHSLNETVGGRLIANIPIGAPCYHSTFDVVTQKYDLSTYDAASCAAVQQAWHTPPLHEQSSSSIMQTYFANDSCNPIADQSGGKCGIGSYAQYSINVTGDADAIAGIAFAKKHNIRLLVRNTGHDYLGKSTGFGSLALWTHHLKEISPVLNYQSSYYTGPALKVQGGVQVGEMYDYLEQQGYMAIGGECPTVGLAGGYLFAGGHAPTTSKLGLAADKLLEVQGILANGTTFTATPTQNTDMYWFLAGSGAGGTIAYIQSATFQIFQDFPVSGAILTLPYAGILTEDEFWALIDTWHSLTPGITDAGAYAYAFYKTGYFQIWPLFAPDLTQSQTLALLRPLTDQLAALQRTHPSLAYSLRTSTHPTFNRAYLALFPALGSGTLQWSSRLIPRHIITHQPATLSHTLRTLFATGNIMVEAIMNPVAHPIAPNSVLPAWRSSIIDLVVGKPYNDSAPFHSNTAHITSAGGGTYMNEADAEDPLWRESFYGRNYPRQLAIKKLYDPSGVWYAKTAVGSEYWAEDAQQRLCPVTVS